MIEIKFTQISKVNDDSISGVVRYYDDDTEEIKYYDDNWIGEFDRPMAISDVFADAIANFDLTGLLGDYDEDDTHIIHNFRDFYVIVNPNDDFLDTLVYESDASYVEDFKCNIRTSIESVIDSILDNDLSCKRLNHNTIRCEAMGAGWSFRVCFGDREIADGFQSSMNRFFIKGDD